MFFPTSDQKETIHTIIHVHVSASLYMVFNRMGYTIYIFFYTPSESKTLANLSHRKQRDWRFSSGGNRFDGKYRPARVKGKPISPALKRGVRRCKRCRNRVVSNVDNCPYCGKSLLPFYQRLWFWLIIVFFIGAAVACTIYLTVPQQTTDTPHPVQPGTPTVVGNPEASIKGLSLGTTITVDDLETTVTRFLKGPLDREGEPLMVLTMEFQNNRTQSVIIYSTQWMVQLADGTRIDTYLGSTIDGITISGNFEAFELRAGEGFTGQLYFECAEPEFIVYQPSPLAYNEELLVTWSVPIAEEETGLPVNPEE